MAIHIFWRLLVMTLGLLLGWKLGQGMTEWLPIATPITESYYPYIVSVFLALIGFLTAPWITIVPFDAVRKKLSKVNVHALLMGVIGAFVGLLISALMALPLSMLPGRWGQISPLVVTVAFAMLFAMTMIMRERDLFSLIGIVVGREGMRRKRNVVLLDTSVIIDGRIADICQSGFIRETMIVPRFVLDELQHIADSADVLRRNRGRRGLDVLNRMQKDDSMPLEISEIDTDQVHEVDAKLVKLAQRLQCPVVTNDFNLNRVAELQGVPVMNINELANAVKAVVLPGETLAIQIIQEGKEHGQGVGYLDDGTMVVVEDGRRHIGDSVSIAVTRVLQTVAGRMIFGQIQSGNSR